MADLLRDFWMRETGTGQHVVQIHDRYDDDDDDDQNKITCKLVISHWTNEMRFSTHSRILFSSEYFHYKIFINEKCL
jgi:hypothetical protein